MTYYFVVVSYTAPGGVFIIVARSSLTGMNTDITQSFKLFKHCVYNAHVLINSITFTRWGMYIIALLESIQTV